MPILRLMAIGKHIPLILLLAFALVVKFGYLFFALPDPSSPAQLSIDAMYHYKWASLIASGDLLTNTPYFRAPLYPFLLALLLKVSGNSILFVRIIQMLAGCLSLVLAYRIADHVAGKTAAIIAFLLLILYPIMTYFDGELFLDSLFTLFALATLYHLMVKNDDKEHPLKVGLLFSLAALTRPTILIFLPVIIFYYVRRWKTPAQRRPGVKTALIFMTTVIVLIAPVTVINFLSSGQFILISYQDGINFFIGNNPDADGLTSNLPQIGRDWDLNDADYLASQETGHRILYSEQSRFWYGKGWDFIRTQPGRFAELFVRKLYFLFSGHEVSNNRPLDEVVFENRLLSLLPVRFSHIVALAVLPLFLVRRNRHYLMLFYSLVLAYGLAIALFFVSSRFRLPIVPFVAVLAGWGLVSLWEVILSRKIGYRLFWGVVTAAGVLVLASSQPFSFSLENPDLALYLRGNQALRAGDFDLAAARFDSLTQRRPFVKNSSLNLGIALLKTGQTDRAAAAFRQELVFSPQSAEAANNLGVVFLLNQQRDSARIFFRQALSVKPYYAEAAINYLRSARGIEDQWSRDSIDRFRGEFRPAVENEPEYLFEEALYFTDYRRYDEAIADHLLAFDLMQNRAPSVSFKIPYGADAAEKREELVGLVFYQLGYLYGLTGQYENSVKFSRRAVERTPDLKEAYINLISGYRSLGETGRADSIAAVFLTRWPQSPSMDR